MSSNLILFIFFYFAIITSVVGYGLLIANAANLKNTHYNKGYLGLFGVFFLIFYSYVSHFFIPHNYSNNLIILTLGLLSFIYFFEKKKKSEYILFYLFFLILFISFVIFKSHDDFSYYHFPYTYYLTQNNLLVGIGNFNHGFRTPSSIFYLNSLFYLPIIKYYFFHLGAVIIMGFSSLILLEYILKKMNKKKIDIIFFLSLMGFIFINIFFYRISEHGTDRSAQILIFLLIIELIILINADSQFRENSTKFFVLLILVISLKSFYILYLILLFPLFFYFIKDKKIIYVKDFLKNPFFYLSVLTFIFILLINFFNSGCLIYPVGITCFENFSWTIPLQEVSQMNNWYEQWSKGGAGPNFRVDNPEIYIRKFNWVGNWMTVYFFNKVSDFLYGIIFLSVVLFIIFYSKNNKVEISHKGIILIYIILILLFAEWFYNHPALRYGGYPLIALLLFLPIAQYLSKRDYLNFNINIRAYFLIFLTLSVFVTRNFNRLHNEEEKYKYKPMKKINYHVDNSYFRIQNIFNDIIKVNKKCLNKLNYCEEHKNFNMKKEFNYIIFFRK
jgi:hypothetical protein